MGFRKKPFLMVKKDEMILEQQYDKGRFSPKIPEALRQYVLPTV